MDERLSALRAPGVDICPGHSAPPIPLSLHIGQVVPFQILGGEEPRPTIGRPAVEANVKKASPHSYRVAFEQNCSRCIDRGANSIGLKNRFNLLNQPPER